MSVMVIHQGNDPIVVVLCSDRGTLELTERQCAAIRIAGAPQQVAGQLNTPKPPQGAPVAPTPPGAASVPYQLIHDCIIDQNGFWRGGSHDMTRAILSAIDRNPVLFAREAIDAAHATGFRDGAADMDKRTMSQRASLAEELTILRGELEKTVRAKDVLAKQLVADHTNQLRTQLENLVIDVQVMQHTVGALLRNHPPYESGGVGQLANGAETANLWRELANNWRRLNKALGGLVDPNRCDAPAGARTSSGGVTFLPPREQRAWSIYCDESLKATVGKGESACAGSRWGYDTWAALPEALQREYLDKGDSAGDRRDPPTVARTGG